jgi:uncharacterized delta-60 repeat protein/uncharacterized repeat protein (TIGR02543 family)
VRKLLLFALVAAHLVVLPQSQTASAFNVDGLPDTTFAVETSTSGTRIDTGTARSTFATSVRLDENQIIVGGSYYDTTTSRTNYLLKSFNNLGVENQGFTNTFNQNLLNDRIHTEFVFKHLAIQDFDTSKKIVAVGYEIIPSTTYSEFMMRFNADGSLDSTFGTNGKVTLSNQSVYSLQVQKQDLKIIYLTRLNTSDGSSGLTVKRLVENGQQDTQFGPVVNTYFRAGEVSLGDDNKVVWAYKLILDRESRILVYGSVAYRNGPTYPYALRLENSGLPDSTFGNNGEFILSDSNYVTVIQVADIQGDGKIVLGGYEQRLDSNVSPAVTKMRQTILRVNENGTLDTDFGTAGRFINSMSGPDLNSNANIQDSMLTDIKVRLDGKIVAAGFRWQPIGNWDFEKYQNLLRLNSTGTLDTTFGSSSTGVFDTNQILENGNTETQLLLNSDNSFYTVGGQVVSDVKRGFISKWTGTAPAFRYSVMYQPGLGTGSMSPDVGTAATVVFKSNTFTRSGYVFDGWSFGSSNYINEQQVVLTAPTDIVLTAKWRKIRIIFNPNGGTGSMTFQEYEGVPIRLPLNSFSNTGTYLLAGDGRANGTVLGKDFNYAKVFNGWSSSQFPDLSSDSFENQDVIESLTSDLTLYAKWRDPAVFFDLNGSSGYAEPQDLQSYLSCCFGQRYASRSFRVPELNNGLGSNGLQFVGWNSSADGTGTIYYDSGSGVSRLSDLDWLQDQKIYAIWNSKPVVRDVRPLSRDTLQINFTPSHAINGRTLKEYRVEVENLTDPTAAVSIYIVPASEVSTNTFNIDDRSANPTLASGNGFSSGVDYRLKIQSYFGFLENGTWSGVSSSVWSDQTRSFNMPLDCNTGGACSVGEVGPGLGTVFHLASTPINGMSEISLQIAGDTQTIPSSSPGIYLEGITGKPDIVK